mmetsp:Transcript_23366/g.54340  ORF Transcript_23366/g.54340 Transcript_23366/m.54340 type:complete len:253 (+) Transcript_23366:97-855(+)
MCRRGILRGTTAMRICCRVTVKTSLQSKREACGSSPTKAQGTPSQSTLDLQGRSWVSRCGTTIHRLKGRTEEQRESLSFSTTSGYHRLRVICFARHQVRPSLTLGSGFASRQQREGEASSASALPTSSLVRLRLRALWKVLCRSMNRPRFRAALSSDLNFLLLGMIASTWASMASNSMISLIVWFPSEIITFTQSALAMLRQSLTSKTAGEILGRLRSFETDATTLGMTLTCGSLPLKEGRQTPYTLCLRNR